MRQRGFLSVVVVASFFLIFVYPLNTGISSPIRSNEHVAYVAGAQSAQIGLHNEIIPLSGPGRGNDMLQFRAGGHVLGFQPNKVYLAGMDHALSVEFLGTKGVMPRAAADESNEIKAAPALQEVSYAGLWPGISVVYESARDGITESTYHLAPGADISKIRLRYNVPVERQKDGSLRFSFASGFVTESAPVAWQEIDGRRVPVEASFKVSKNEVGFSVAKYDARFPLIIDPIYQWNTFYGSSSDDYGNGIAVDGSGNVYVTGESYAAWGSPLNAYTGGDDIVILKLNSSGVLQWNTFYGSSADDFGIGIAVDGSGDVYVTGGSGATWGSPLNAYTGGSDIFVLKLNSSGVLQWNTFYGSSDFDDGTGIAVDGSGNVYVTGESYAAWGSPLNAYAGDRDIFVLKLNSSGALQWNTFYGSSSYDYGVGIAVDGGGNVYVTGESGATWGSPLNSYTGDGDIFVLKLSSSGALQWNTFYGGSGSDDTGVGIAVDGSGNVYVTGESGSTWGSPLNAYTGNADIFVLKLTSSGVLQWNTFYGSSDDDYGAGIAVDGSGNVYVTGESSATWGSPLNAYTGHADISVLKLSSSGALQWNTFYGSSAYEEGSWMAVDGGGNVYVTGRGNATWGSPLNAYTGGYDIVVLKVASSTPLPAGRQTFTYPPAASPGLSETLAGDMPIGVGSAANGGDTLGIRIGTHEFSSPVDMYVLFYFPEISPDIYSWTGSSFEPYSSSGLVPWKQSVTGPVDESLFGDLSVSGLGLPDGTYYLGLLVTPPGVSDLSLYYLWVTDFAVPQPAP